MVSQLSRFAAGFVLLLSALTPAAAQVTCTAFVANQPLLRQEGTTEAVGDVILSCSGTPEGAQLGSQPLVFYVNNAPITSRQLYSGTSAPSNIPTEAALLINDCTSTAGNSPTFPSFACANSAPIQGLLESGDLFFSGYTLPTSGQNFQIRITNVRVNANAVAAGTVISGNVLTSFPVQNQNNLSLGVVESSLSVSVSPELNLSGCPSFSSTSAGTVTISQLFNTAFKSPAVSASNSTPGGWYGGLNTESQTVLSAAPAGWTNQLTGVVPGQADHATRIRVNLSNIPAGITVLLPVNVSGSSGGGTLVATSGGDLNAFSMDPGVQIPVTTSGSITYEVRSQSSTSFAIPILISSAGNAGAGPILISVTYAGTTAENSVEIPTFVDTSVLTPLVSFTSCLQTLQLAFTGQPFSGPAGSAISPVVVQVQNGTGSLDTSSNAAITVAATPSGPSASVNAVNGIATFSNDLIFSTAGNYALSASSSGISSGTSRPLLIGGQATTISLSELPYPTTYGQIETLTASVSPSSATGSVTFYDGVNILETKPLVSGYAVLATNLLPSGFQSLTAIYSGDSIYAPSSMKTGPQTVTPISAGGFAAAANYPAAADSRSIAVGDFNGDGKADLAVSTASGVLALLGNGNGTFQAAVSYVAGSNPASVAVGDFNGDGKTDIVAGDEGSNTVSVLLGNGDGTFRTAVSYPIGNIAYSVAVGDFNGDGKADLAVSTPNGVLVMLGNGDGTFLPAVTYGAGNSVMFAAIGDFNGDGWPDLVIANTLANTVSVLLGNGDGTFQLPVSYAAGSSPTSIAVADFNGDGSSDIAVGGNGFVNVLLGNGNGTFQAAVSYAGGTYVVAGDFNGDGVADLAAANQSTNSVSLLLGTGNGTFQAAVSYPVGASPGFAAVSDYNGDGRTDLAVANYNGGTVSVLLGISTTPVLSIMKSHSGNFAQGQSGATYTVTVSNGSTAGPTSGTVTVTETVPAGMTLVSMAGTGWTCPGGGTTCTRSDALTTGASYPAITVTVNVAANASSTVTNSVVVSGGGSAAANWSDPTTITVLPSVYIDVPSAGAVLSGIATLSGWAIENTSVVGPNRISSVAVFVDGSQVGTATYGNPRSDVCALWPGRQGCPNVGWSYTLNAALFAAGSHTLNIVATDSAGNAGSSQVSFQTTPVLPSVWIDAPTANATVSGMVAIGGWAIENTSVVGPNKVSSVTVFVDGSQVGTATYGSPRSDVCSIWPGRQGCPNVGWNYILNAALFAAGSHTLNIVATDSAGNAGSSQVSFQTTPVLPSVWIDMPTANATLSGMVAIGGWAIENTSVVGPNGISSIAVFVDGNQVGKATYGSPRSDVCALWPGRPGCPNVGWTYTLNAALFAAGSHTLNIAATDSAGNTGMQQVTFQTQMALQTSTPSVWIDVPTANQTLNGMATISGWALENTSVVGPNAISSIAVFVDGNQVGTATYGSPRSDVCSLWPGRPGCPNVGWTYNLNTTLFAAGSHALTIVATDSAGNTGSIRRTFQGTLSPSVWIDVPTANQTLSGTATISGWAIESTSAVGPNAISNVAVFVDGSQVGTATYNSPRSDVCALWPGRPGCPNVGWTYNLNTSSLAPGTHTLNIVATDSAGNTGSGQDAFSK